MDVVVFEYMRGGGEGEGGTLLKVAGCNCGARVEEEEAAVVEVVDGEHDLQRGVRRRRMV